MEEDEDETTENVDQKENNSKVQKGVNVAEDRKGQRRKANEAMDLRCGLCPDQAQRDDCYEAKTSQSQVAPGRPHRDRLRRLFPPFSLSFYSMAKQRKRKLRSCLLPAVEETFSRHSALSFSLLPSRTKRLNGRLTSAPLRLLLPCFGLLSPLSCPIPKPFVLSIISPLFIAGLPIETFACVLFSVDLFLE